MRSSLALLAAVAAVPVLAGSAAAASDKEVVPIACDNGHTYSVEVSGNGVFTPGRLVGSTAVLVPHAFGVTTGTLKDASGAVVESFTEPAVTKGSGKQKGDLTCTYSQSFTSDGSDPDGPPAGYVFSFSGSVTGRLVPR